MGFGEQLLAGRSRNPSAPGDLRDLGKAEVPFPMEWPWKVQTLVPRSLGVPRGAQALEARAERSLPAPKKPPAGLELCPCVCPLCLTGKVPREPLVGLGVVMSPQSSNTVPCSPKSSCRAGFVPRNSQNSVGSGAAKPLPVVFPQRPGITRRERWPWRNWEFWEPGWGQQLPETCSEHRHSLELLL